MNKMHQILIVQATGIPYRHFCASYLFGWPILQIWVPYSEKAFFSWNVPYSIAECQGMANDQSRFSDFARWHHHKYYVYAKYHTANRSFYKDIMDIILDAWPVVSHCANWCRSICLTSLKKCNEQVYGNP